MKLESADEILDFAIEKEEEAARFYSEMAEKAERKSMRLAFQEFALEETAHKQKLLAVKRDGALAGGGISLDSVRDMGIADSVKKVKPGAAMTYQDALILAMQREKAAFRMYTFLASQTDDEATRTLLLSLAQEEARHKLRFEVEYDDYVLAEN